MKVKTTASMHLNDAILVLTHELLPIDRSQPTCTAKKSKVRGLLFSKPDVHRHVTKKMHSLKFVLVHLKPVR